MYCLLKASHVVLLKRREKKKELIWFLKLKKNRMDMLKTDSRPLEKKPGVPLKDLLFAVAVGNRDEELFTSLANRLTRLDKQITEKEKQQFEKISEGKTVSQVVKDMLNAFNPDVIENVELRIKNAELGSSPLEIETAIKTELEKLQNDAAKVFTGELNEYIENVRKAHEQKIDLQNPDTVLNVGWDKDNKQKAEALIKDFEQWMQEHKDELTALQIFYSQPYRRRELTYTMIKEVLEKLVAEKPSLAPMHIWRCYEQLERVTGQPKNELIALVSLLRNVTGMDTTLTDFSKAVDKNFRDWILKKNAGQHNRLPKNRCNG